MRKLRLEELNRLSIDEYKQIEKVQMVLVLDNIRSALNVGSFFRTSDAFAIDKLYLTGITAKPPHKEINKTAIGAHQSVDWEHHSDVLTVVQQLRAEGYLIVGVEQTTESVMLNQLKLKDQKLALIMGNEVDGISDAILDYLDICVEIPQFGTKHSLNVSVCGGIVMWDIINQLKNNHV